MKTTLIPYLNFDGDCASAMKFYKSVFAGKLDISPFSKEDIKKYPKLKNRTIHAMLKSADVVLMASDGQPGIKVKFGDSVHVSINGDDDTKISGYFKKLAKGGKINMKLEKQFWGDKFGILTDKFKIRWMVNISPKKK